MARPSSDCVEDNFDLVLGELTDLVDMARNHWLATTGADDDQYQPKGTCGQCALRRLFSERVAERVRPGVFPNAITATRRLRTVFVQIRKRVPLLVTNVQLCVVQHSSSCRIASVDIRTTTAANVADMAAVSNVRRALTSVT